MLWAPGDYLSRSGRWSGRAVCGPVETRPAPYSGLPASNAWILVVKLACVLICSPIAAVSLGSNI